MSSLRSQLSCGLGPPLLEHIPALVCLPCLLVFVVNSLSCLLLLIFDLCQISLYRGLWIPNFRKDSSWTSWHWTSWPNWHSLSLPQGSFSIRDSAPYPTFKSDTTSFRAL